MNIPLTPEQILAFHEELAFLVRNGSPLEPGIRSFSAEMSGSVQQWGTRLADRMSTGTSLRDALAAESTTLPPTYRRILSIGEETGKLQLALESLIRMTRMALDLRRMIGMAMIYPLFVVAFAYALFLLFITEFWERYRIFIVDFSIPSTWYQRMIQSWGVTIGWWWWIPPVVAIILGIRSRMAIRRDLLALSGFSQWLPGVRKLQRHWELFQFSELCALLVEQGVPLERGLIQAAELSGSHTLSRGAQALSEQLVSGGLQDTAVRGPLPEIVVQAIRTATSNAQLSHQFRLISQMYHRRVLRQVLVLKFLIPACLTIFVAGTAVLAYSFMLFQPIAYLLQELTR